MSRVERIRHKSARLELRAMKAAMRSSGYLNRCGRGAIRDGQTAEKAYRVARQLRLWADDLERAAEAEKKKRKQKKDWWREEHLKRQTGI